MRKNWWDRRDARWLVFGLMVCGVVLLTGLGVAFAQDAQPAPAAVPVAAPAGLPTAQNPLPADPFDLVTAITALITAFRGAWYLGVALLLFVLINILRGKVKLGDWIVRIPWLSDWLDDAGRKAKAWIILCGTGVGCAFAGMAAAPEPWTAGGVATAMLSGLVGGIVIALAAMGVNDLVQTGKTPEKDVASAVKRLDAMPDGKKPALDEETAKRLEEWVKETRAKLGAGNG